MDWGSEASTGAGKAIEAKEYFKMSFYILEL
jgi:hypothetical protein